MSDLVVRRPPHASSRRDRPTARLSQAPERYRARPCRATRHRGFPWPLIATIVILATTPLWLTRVGLYQYLALEIAIFMIYAMGYNLLLGNSGLPSFGHGAFFGIGAYGFGLLQLKVWSNLWFDLAGAVAVAACWRARWSRRSSRTGAASTTRC